MHSDRSVIGTMELIKASHLTMAWLASNNTEFCDISTYTYFLNPAAIIGCIV